MKYFAGSSEGVLRETSRPGCDSMGHPIAVKAP